MAACSRHRKQWSWGLYLVADGKPLDNPDFVTVALKVPKGAIRLISAHSFHRMTAQVPHAVYLAIAANDQAPALRYPPLRLFWYSKAAFEDGVTAVAMDGINVRIYSAERTLSDCFKYRNKIGIDVCVEAPNLYRRRGRMKLDRLEHYAKLCRVERVMRPYMEAIHSYWVQFAKTGNPNGPGLPSWRRYSSQSDVLLNFTNAGPVAQPDPWKECLDLA